MGHHASREGKLTPKQARFVDEYLVDLNAKAAAGRAGYAVSNPKNADRIGYANLQIPLVQQAIEAKQKRRAGRMEIKADDIAEEFRRIAAARFTDIAEVKDGRVTIRDSSEWTQEQAATVAEVTPTKFGLKVKMHDKIAAADKLARLLGMYDDRLTLEHSGPAPVVQVVFGDEPSASQNDPPA